MLLEPHEWSNGLQMCLMPIWPLLLDDGVNEIEVNAFDQIWVKGPKFRGHVRLHDHDGQKLGWEDRVDFLTAMKSIAQCCGRIITDDKPLFDGRLPGGERVNMVHPPVNSEGVITIRKFPKVPMSLERLLAFGSISPEIKQALETLVLAHQTILIVGGTNTGKTSFLNALSRVIPDHERVVSIEDAAELQLTQPNKVSMEVMKPFKRDVDPVSMGDLAVNSLRMTMDRIIWGECRDESALQMLNIFNTGHSGGMTTVHANSAYEGLTRLELLVQFGHTTMGPLGIAQLIASSIQIVVFLQEFKEDGSRKVVQILEVEQPGVKIMEDRHEFITRKLVCYERNGYEKAGDNGDLRIAGNWTIGPVSRRLQSILDVAGLPWPASGTSLPQEGAAGAYDRSRQFVGSGVGDEMGRQLQSPLEVGP